MVTTEKENSIFQFVKVKDSMTCEQFSAQKDTLFDIEGFDREPDS